MLRVLHLAAEFNATRTGSNLSMQELMARFEDGTHHDNVAYFQRTRAQAHLAASMMNSTPANSCFYYSDVSLERATGRHSEKSIYKKAVIRSLPQHLKLMKNRPADIVIVAGALAFAMYVEIILPHLIREGLAPKVLLRARNPSAQGHFGSPRKWAQRYQNAASRLRLPNPNNHQLQNQTQKYTLKASNSNEEFYLEKIK